MGRAAGKATCQAIGNFHQQAAATARGQDRTKNDKDKHIARDHLKRLSEHATCLSP